MSKLILPNSFSFQPQYPAPLDSGSKYRNRIKFAYSVGRGPHDGAHGLGSVTGTMTYGAGEKGRSIKPADASSYLGFADNQDYNILGDITVVAVIRTAGFTVQQGIVTKCETGGGTNTPFALLTEIGGAVSFNRSNASGGTQFRVWASSATLSSNSVYVIAASQVADMSVAPKFYLNGIKDTGAATSLYGGSGTGAPTGNSTSLKIGNRTDLASQCFHEIYDVHVLSGVLSDAEIAEYSRNVYAIWKAPARRLWVVPAAAGSVALTGQSLTGAQGLLAPSASVALAGQSLTSVQGSLGAATAKTLSGQALASSQGTLSPSTAIPLTGSALTGAQGTLTPSISSGIVLSGQSLTGSQGTVAPSASVPMVGQSSALAQGALTPGISLALSGQSLSSAQGSVAVSVNVPLTGQAAALSQGTLGVSGNISVALTGIGLTASQGSLGASVPSTGGHFAGDYRKNRKRNLVDHDRDDIARLIREQIEGVREEIAQAEVPQEVKTQAKEAIKPYQSASSVEVQALQQELTKVRQMLHMWEQQVKRQRDEDEELLFMFH